MVRTTSSRTSRVVLAGLGLGALAAGALTAALTGAPANAQAATSTAYGVSAAGVEGKPPQPSVSSPGEVKTVSGSVSGMGWNATGITVKAGAGTAEAVVGNITVAGRSLGAASATCRDGAVTYQLLPNINEAHLRVRSAGTGASMVEILGAGGEAVQTITVAVALCAKAIPPTTTVPPTTTQQPTTTPTTTQPPTGTPSPTRQPTGTQRPTTTTTTPKPTDKPIQPAPAPEIKDGHHPVTG